MVVVALISAFIAMRLAIHGREAVVPPLIGLSVAEASSAAGHQGLHLTVENRFYSSDVPAGHVLSQDPPTGFRVRRDWPVRITESLGSQRVSIPDLVGQSERIAMITIRQLGLEPGSVIRMPVSGTPDVVIAQSPAPDAGEMMSPRISLMVSDALQPSDSGSADSAAYVMPSLVGLSYAAAAARSSSAGLKLVVAEEVIAPPGPVGAPAGPVAPAAAGTAAAGSAPAAASPAPAPAPVPTSGTVVVQSPPAGGRVQPGDVVHVTVSHDAEAQ
ncbi:MAG TPA: PASTA domain-containing protein [Acidobacteriaceae bacterium]|jgi:beta-lactam-binding protein with PASTA domain|nr:PASTA domain-containing protein [Acidobacteriaceae bacterium]